MTDSLTPAAAARAPGEELRRDVLARLTVDQEQAREQWIEVAGLRSTIMDVEWRWPRFPGLLLDDLDDLLATDDLRLLHNPDRAISVGAWPFGDAIELALHQLFPCPLVLADGASIKTPSFAASVFSMMAGGGAAPILSVITILFVTGASGTSPTWSMRLNL